VNLAFYYHIPVTIKVGKLFVPSYLGVFLDSLAGMVETLSLLMHESKPGSSDVEEADYPLMASNITWVTLGLKTPAWHRDLFHSKILPTAMRKIDHCDCIIVRSPSPLAPYFHRYAKQVRVVFMVVGDFGEEAQHARPKTLREWAVWKYVAYNDRMFVKAMKHTDVVVNSPKLFRKYQPISKSIFQIKTTTLSGNDFFERADTCQDKVLQLLYTGRIDPQKGLFELIGVLPQLLSKNFDVVLNLVGWEPDANKPVEQALLQKAAEFGVSKHVVFHGRKTVGADLNAMYRMADIYLIPSYHEGFPRTIWEAMANSLPVIASRVGAIPEYLTDRENAILIEPRKVEDIVDSILLLLKTPELRQKIISNGQTLANENTLEVQTKHLIDYLKQAAE